MQFVRFSDPEIFEPDITFQQAEIHVAQRNLGSNDLGTVFINGIDNKIRQRNTEDRKKHDHHGKNDP